MPKLTQEMVFEHLRDALVKDYETGGWMEYSDWDPKICEEVAKYILALYITPSQMKQVRYTKLMLELYQFLIWKKTGDAFSGVWFPCSEGRARELYG